MSTVDEPYFTQTSQWAEFWAEANGKNHYVHTISIENAVTHVYQYPWYFGYSFFYIPAGPIIDTTSEQSIESQMRFFFTKLNELASQSKIVFTKIDFSPTITKRYALTSYNDVSSFLASLFSIDPPYSRTTQARKRIMYTSTSTIDIARLHYTSQLSTVSGKQNDVSPNLDELTSFFEQTKEFWKSVSSTHKAKTKKSLTQNWQWDETKSEQNFEAFWTLYSATSKRQRFFIQPKKYFAHLYSKPQSRILLLKSQEGTIESVWFGYLTKTSLIYLYGGNSPYSMEHYGQYLIHLIALYTCAKLKLDSYDLGGLDEKSGYSIFKERYKGDIVSFYGPVDIIYKSVLYYSIETVIPVFKQCILSLKKLTSIITK